MKNVFYICFLFILKLAFNLECDRSAPIFQNGFCRLIFCSEAQFHNGECIISNELIKTQWLTNIIWIGEKNSRFINFANYSNGDMVVETSPAPGSNKRFFYGLKADGNYLFEEDGNHQLIMNVKDLDKNDINKRQYAENFCIKLRDSGIEYIVSVANEDQYFEAYNLKDKGAYSVKSTQMVGKPMNGLIHSSLNIYTEAENYIIFISWMYNGTHTHFFVQKFKFSSTSDEVIHSERQFFF